MANYGNALLGISKYGSTPKLAYSVEPMSVLVTDFYESYVSWQVPSGTYSRVRLVRNQNSYPETAEDGVVVYDAYTTSLTKVIFNDGGGVEDLTTSPVLSPGKPIYYKMFLFNADKVWIDAGSTSSVVPKDHDTTKKLVNLLPRVFTSSEQSPLAEVNESSALYYMLDAYGFDLEESITYLDLLLPDHTLTATTAAMLPLEFAQYGLVYESGLPVKNQKQLIREAIYSYTHKGTLNGLGTYIEALSSYAPTITVSKNLLLSPQDSTFYKSTGNWALVNGGAISFSTDENPPTNSNNIDLTYTLKVVATGAGSITLGATDPIIKGVPITPGKSHIMSAQVKSPLSAGTITPSLTYYDSKGVITGTATSGTATSATNTWAQTSVTKAATKYVNVGVVSAIGASGTITYTTSTAHGLVSGNTVTISGFSGSDTGFNLTGATIASAPTTTTFTITSAVTGTSTTSGYVTNSGIDAVYASLKLAWSAAGTYYIDMVCLQEGTTAAYDEARAIDIFLNPNKTNYINNPSFETNVTSSWTLAGSATAVQDVSISDIAYSGVKSAKITGTGAWTYTANVIPVSAGNYYSISGLVKSSTGLTMTVIGKDSLGTTTTTDVYSWGINANWTEKGSVALVGSAETTVSYTVVFSGSTGTFFLDCIQFEQSPVPTDYIDGNLSTITSNPYGAVWQGSTNNSYSSVYHSKPLKVPRIGQTLVNWVPQNAWWRLRSYAGLEYTNLTAV